MTRAELRREREASIRRQARKRLAAEREHARTRHHTPPPKPRRFGADVNLRSKPLSQYDVDYLPGRDAMAIASAAMGRFVY